MPKSAAPPGVSFVCPVYNKEAYLEGVCAAIRAQEGEFDREFIFVDDGSGDRSVELVRNATRDWPDTRIVVQENQGPSGSTNTGCRLARFSFRPLLLGPRACGALSLFTPLLLGRSLAALRVLLRLALGLRVLGVAVLGQLGSHGVLKAVVVDRV